MNDIANPFSQANEPEIEFDDERGKLLRNYAVRVFENAVEIDGVEADLNSYITFRQAVLAAEQAILREMHAKSSE